MQNNVYIVHNGGICVADITKETNKLYKIANIKDIFGSTYFWGRQVYKDDPNIFLYDYAACEYLLNKKLDTKNALIKMLLQTEGEIDEIVSILDNIA